jgi:hypothetical protein
MEGWGVSLDQQTNKQTKRKPSVARKKLEKPSRAMRDAALRTLHGVVTDSATPVYVKVSAAKALLREDGTEGDEIDSPTGPPVLLVIPDNGRDPGLATLGVDRSPGVVRILYDGKSEAGLVDLARWRTEVAVEIEDTHLALLPPPDRPKPLTPAERQKRRRERLAATRAAGQSASAR